MRKIFLAIILMFIFSIPFRGHALSETHTIVVTNNTEDHRPINVFDCRDRIFVYVNWKGLQGGEHSLEAYWYKPGNKTQDHTVYKFNAPMAATWLWIELKGGRGSKLFKSLDHGAGFEEFVGQWNVKVNLDGEYLSTQYFMVVC